MQQIQQVSSRIDSFITEAGLASMTPRLVVGDLNVEETDPVCGHLVRNGYGSAFASLHRQKRVITHLNHRGEEVMVDHVFVKAPGYAGHHDRKHTPQPGLGGAGGVGSSAGVVTRLHDDVRVEEAALLPTSSGGQGNDGDTWCQGFDLSDHRPLTVRLRFPGEEG
ncbi:unnamed protein product [Discosporangium mesarthrocarpum]